MPRIAFIIFITWHCKWEDWIKGTTTLNTPASYKHFLSNRRSAFISFCLSPWRRSSSDTVDKPIALEGLLLTGDVGRDELPCVEVSDLEETAADFFFDFTDVGNTSEKVWQEHRDMTSTNSRRITINSTSFSSNTAYKSANPRRSSTRNPLAELALWSWQSCFSSSLAWWAKSKTLLSFREKKERSSNMGSPNKSHTIWTRALLIFPYFFLLFITKIKLTNMFIHWKIFQRPYLHCMYYSKLIFPNFSDYLTQSRNSWLWK